MPTTCPSSPLDEVLASVPEKLRGIVAELRKLLAEVHPEATVLAWPKQSIISFGIGPRKMTEHYAYFSVHSSHVNLGFYYGARLHDPVSLLEGSGKTMRHIKVRSQASAKSSGVRVLVLAAFRELKAREKPAV